MIQYLDVCPFSIALTTAVAQREQDALTVYVSVSTISEENTLPLRVLNKLSSNNISHNHQLILIL